MRTKEFATMMTYSLLVVFTVLMLGVGYITHLTSQPVASTEVLTSQTVEEKDNTATSSVAWQTVYPVVTPMQIGSTTVQASVAKTWPERIKGLSDTPYLPEDVVKFFVFDSLGFHSIWMKDMNYSIDIIWLDGEGKIVYLVEEAAPESFPAMFVPDKEAKYVVETVSGFIQKNQITVDSSVTLPNF
jgi:uncharacterized membrane protein (UPF0127 family)